MIIGRFTGLLVIALAVLWPAAASPAAPPRKEREAPVSAELSQVRSKVAAIMERVAADSDFRAANLLADELFEQVAGQAPLDQPEIFRQASVARRTMAYLRDVEPLARQRILSAFLQFPELAESVIMLIQEPHDKPMEALTVLDRLILADAEAVAQYPSLAAAICVVHDRPLQRRINENTAAGCDGVSLFRFFVRHEREFEFSIRQLPAPLLTYVVDITGSMDEVGWAVRRYSGTRDVGALFFSIDYDHEHLKTGRPKKITELGFTLPNIQQYGGICADQAYFATTVGKCIGVPTTYVTGRSGDMAHAWVGYLKSDKDSAWWDFDSGRYDEYKGVRGNLVDPQTGRRINDGELALAAGMNLTPQAARHQAVALLDVVSALKQHQKDKTRWRGGPLFESAPGGAATATPRPIDSRTVLELAEAMVKLSPCDARGWDLVQDLAKRNELTLEDKKKWAAAADRLCGPDYPDFYLETVAPMIETVEDPKEQDRLWEIVIARLTKRLDLAAEVRFQQGQLWEKKGDLNRAGRAYEDVIQRMTNAGPFVMQALARAEDLLRKSGREKRVPDLYADAWTRTARPTSLSPPVFRQANWYKIARILKDRLEEFGRTRDAAKVAKELAPFMTDNNRS